MDAVEKAIRNAFEKGDPTDRAFREKIYRLVYAALDRAMAGNPNVTGEAAERRRDGLQATIVRVEQEFLPALAGERPADPAVSRTAAKPDMGNDVLQPLRDDPGFLGGAFPDGPDSAAGEAPSIAVAEERADYPPDEEILPGGQVKRRRRGFAIAFLAATVLAAAGIGIWWAGSVGLLRSAEERDTSVPNPPADFEEEDFAPDGAAEGESEAPPPLAAEDDGQRDWISVFSPSDATPVGAPGDATAEVVADGEERFIRIRSGPSGSAVTFDVGQGILERLAGKTAVFAISARAEDGKPTQISVDCAFGELGDCGRKRYAVTQEKSDYLFEIALPRRSPGAAGAIAIVSDIDNAGKAVDIYEIKVDIQ